MFHFLPHPADVANSSQNICKGASFMFQGLDSLWLASNVGIVLHQQFMSQCGVTTDLRQLLLNTVFVLASVYSKMQN